MPDKVTKFWAAGRHESAAALAEAALSGEARLTAMSQSLAGLATACALKQTGLRPPSSDLDFQGISFGPQAPKQL